MLSDMNLVIYHVGCSRTEGKERENNGLRYNDTFQGQICLNKLIIANNNVLLLFLLLSASSLSVCWWWWTLVGITV